MRIAYLGQMADVSTENGISKKIRQQGLAWTAAGHTVRYFALTPSAKAWEGLAPLDATLLRRGTLLRRRSASLQLCGLIREWKPDRIYFRYANHEAGLPALFRAIPTVAELNSDDTREYALTLPPHKRLYHVLTRRRLLRSVSGLVPVTRELESRFAWLGVPSQVIANSLDLAATPPLPPPPPAHPLSLVFIGNTGSPWHGLERIGELAELLPDARFEIIGCSSQDWSACSPSPPPANLRFHGMLPAHAYEGFLRNASAAIGTMALFRKSMDEACPLKVREYLALGLPVIAAYEDTDIPPGADYFLRLPNNDRPLAPHAADLRAFLSRWQGRRVDHSGLMALDVSIKERHRLDFMASIPRARSH